MDRAQRRSDRSAKGPIHPLGSRPAELPGPEVRAGGVRSRDGGIVSEASGDAGAEGRRSS